MYKEKATLFLLCETALHAGSGDDVGIVDLPIQREKHTQFPKIEASSLKGAIREAFESLALKPFREENNKQKAKSNLKELNSIFGYDDAPFKGFSKNEMETLFDTTDKEGQVQKGNTDFAGCIAFTDARLLLFPVKSMKGVFVWVTCLQVLNKLATDLAITGVKMATLDRVKSIEIGEGNARVASSAPLVSNVVILEEYAYNATESADIQAFAKELSEIIFSGKELDYWKSLLQKNLVILSDDDFRDFTQMSTEVITRTKIDNETGTVDKDNGALFTEEYLPNDAVLYTSVFASDEYGKQEKTKDAKKVMNYVTERFEKEITYFQLGANATLGKGMLRTTIKKGNSNG
jgi:CRISPR-associated protein Cmr4